MNNTSQTRIVMEHHITISVLTILPFLAGLLGLGENFNGYLLYYYGLSEIWFVVILALTIFLVVMNHKTGASFDNGFYLAAMIFPLVFGLSLLNAAVNVAIYGDYYSFDVFIYGFLYLAILYAIIQPIGLRQLLPKGTSKVAGPTSVVKTWLLVVVLIDIFLMIINTITEGNFYNSNIFFVYLALYFLYSRLQSKSTTNTFGIRNSSYLFLAIPLNGLLLILNLINYAFPNPLYIILVTGPFLISIIYGLFTFDLNLERNVTASTSSAIAKRTLSTYVESPKEATTPSKKEKTTTTTQLSNFEVRLLEELKDGVHHVSIVLYGKYTIISDLVESVRIYASLYESGQKPLVTSVKKYQQKDTQGFYYIGQKSVSGPGTYGSERNNRLVSVPKQHILISSYGRKKIHVRLRMVGLDDKGLERSDLFAHQSEGALFIDFENTNPLLKHIDTSDIDQLLIGLGLVMIRLEGDYNTDLVIALRNWIKREYEFVKKHTKLLGIVSQITTLDATTYEVEEASEALLSRFSVLGTIKQQETLLQLIQQIAMKKPRHSTTVSTWIVLLFSKLSMDYYRYSETLSKIVNLTTKELQDINLDRFLGITPGMSSANQLERLRSQYREWNIRSTSPNQIEAHNSKIIMEYIAKRRAELDHGSS